MKLYVSVALFNGVGSSAQIENKDDFSFTLREGFSLSAKQACRKAAHDLREAAARFDLLAEEAEPYQRKTHERINKALVKP